MVGVGVEGSKGIKAQRKVFSLRGTVFLKGIASSPCTPHDTNEVRTNARTPALET